MAGFVKEKLEEINEFRTEYPDIFNQFFEELRGIDGIYKTGEERVAHLRCFLLGGKRKECIKRLEQEGFKFSQSTLEWIVMRFSRRLSKWKWENPKRKKIRAPKGVELRLYKELDEYLLAHGLKRVCDEPLYVEVERIDGKRFIYEVED